MRMPRPIPTLSAVFLIVACKSSTDGPIATAVLVTPGPNVALSALGQTQQLTATVQDQNGDPLPNATVTWSSSATGVATVSAAGLVAAVTNGSATVTATAGSLTANVSVTVAQVVSAIVKLQGDAQSGTVGQALATSLRVRLNDALGNRVAAAAATFAVASGGGQVSVGSATADAQGEATTSWTLGTSTAVAQQVSVTSGTAAAATFAATPNPGQAAAVVIVAGNNQTAATGTQVAVAPRVRVNDSFGNRKPSTSVTFQPTAGSGSVTGGTVTTDVQGEAQVGSWTLDASAGPDTLVATVTGTAIVTSFGATSVTAGAPANIAAFVGDNQTALVGFATNIRPAVRVTDVNNLAVANVSVTFAVASGGGGVQTATVNTNTNGVAQVGSWSVGAVAGPNSLTATAAPGGINGNPVTINATGAAAAYNIEVRNIGPPLSPSVQLAFDSAEAYWERIIYGDQSNVAINSPSACNTGTAINETVDDVIILARFDSIDGPGQILGTAGACSIRISNGLSIYGLMRFDSADVGFLGANLGAVILHEMGHVLGFSAGLWNTQAGVTQQRVCAQNAPTPSTPVAGLDTHFFCSQGGAVNSARAVFDSIGGTSYTGGNKVPLENCVTGVPPSCGSGNLYSHWREATFDHELMTGFLDAGTNPLSVLTIATFEDNGYLVNYAAAQAYVRVFTAPGISRGPVIDLTNDQYRGPIEVVDDRTGRVLRVIRQQ